MFKNYFRVWTRTKSFHWRSKVFKCDLPRPIVTFLASRIMSVTMDLGFSSGSTSSFLLIQIISFLFLKIFAWSLSLLQACTTVTILHRCTQTVLVSCYQLVQQTVLIATVYKRLSTSTCYNFICMYIQKTILFTSWFLYCFLLIACTVHQAVPC